MWKVNAFPFYKATWASFVLDIDLGPCHHVLVVKQGGVCRIKEKHLTLGTRFRWGHSKKINSIPLQTFQFVFALLCLVVPVKKIRRRTILKSFSPCLIFQSLLFNFLFKAIGVSNQRETTVVWDKITGEPLYNAVGKLLCMDGKCKAFLHLQMLSY